MTYKGLAILVVETKMVALVVEHFKIELCNRNSLGCHIGTVVLD